jgi:hypothetical protein
MRDPVGRDAQRRQAQLVMDEDVCPAHREVAARARLIYADADVTRVMRGHETDECCRPAERAVNPGLAGPLNRLEYDLVVGGTSDILDNGAAGSPVDSRDCGPLGLRGKVNSRGNHR